MTEGPTGAASPSEQEAAPAQGHHDGAPAPGHHDGAPAPGHHDGAPAQGHHDGAPAQGERDAAPAQVGHTAAQPSSSKRTRVRQRTGRASRARAGRPTTDQPHSDQPAAGQPHSDRTSSTQTRESPRDGAAAADAPEATGGAESGRPTGGSPVSTTGADEPHEPAASPAPVLRRPAATVPPVVVDADGLAEAVAALAAAQGPVAVDVERAGGYRYSQRAYLLQLRRDGAGTWLIDPIAVPSLAALAEVLAEPEWVLHAASQDLPSLAELSLHPSSVFDTELAGRLLNSERVGLSAMTEQHLGVALAKDHSAADWSRRPLPDDWLNYAALDVELLLELRAELARLLAGAGREEWARQEFEAVRLAPPPAPRVDPWRRVRGLSTRAPRSLAIAREVWLVRDAAAQAQDRTPTKVLPDMAIAAMATSPPATVEDIARVPGMRNQPAHARRAYFDAVQRAQALSGADLPTSHLPADGAPNHRSWERVNPLAAARHDSARDVLTALAEDIDLPRENLLPPRAFREVVWQLSGEADPAAAVAQPDGDQVAQALLAQGARPWQVDITAAAIATAMVEASASAD